MVQQKEMWDAEAQPDLQPFGRKPNALPPFNLLKTWRLAPRVGFEPTASRLTAECSGFTTSKS